MQRTLSAGLAVVLVTLLLAVSGATASAVGAPPTVTASHLTAQRAYIMWYQAKRHVGERRAVKGQVKSTSHAKSSSGRPTFINVGKKYPNKARFTIVIWGKHRANFPFKPEVKYRGKTLIATGRIRLYRGSAEMFVKSPSAIKIVD